jgi:hypothetical protein
MLSAQIQSGVVAAKLLQHTATFVNFRAWRLLLNHRAAQQQMLCLVLDSISACRTRIVTTYKLLPVPTRFSSIGTRPNKYLTSAR